MHVHTISKLKPKQNEKNLNFKICRKTKKVSFCKTALSFATVSYIFKLNTNILEGEILVQNLFGFSFQDKQEQSYSQKPKYSKNVVLSVFFISNALLYQDQ